MTFEPTPGSTEQQRYVVRLVVGYNHIIETIAIEITRDQVDGAIPGRDRVDDIETPIPTPH